MEEIKDVFSDEELMGELIGALKELQMEDFEAERREVPVKRNVRLIKATFNEPVTVVKWSDGIDTCYKEEDGRYDAEKSFEYCVLKKMIGEDVFNKWRDSCDRLKKTTNIF